MTRKDFTQIAACIQQAKLNSQDNIFDVFTLNTAAVIMADMLKRNHARFNRGKFLAACGVLPPPTR